VNNRPQSRRRTSGAWHAGARALLPLCSCLCRRRSLTGLRGDRCQWRVERGEPVVAANRRCSRGAGLPSAVPNSPPAALPVPRGLRHAAPLIFGFPRDSAAIALATAPAAMVSSACQQGNRMLQGFAAGGVLWLASTHSPVNARPHCADRWLAESLYAVSRVQQETRATAGPASLLHSLGRLASRVLCLFAGVSCRDRTVAVLVAPAPLLRPLCLSRGDSLSTARTRSGPPLQQRMHGQERRRMTLPWRPQQPHPHCRLLLSSLGPILASPPGLRPRTATVRECSRASQALASLDTGAAVAGLLTLISLFFAALRCSDSIPHPGVS
jgi:hypothetical protein